MLASHKWLTELSGVSLDPDTLAEKLTAAGLEVEGMTRFGTGLDRVVVAEVRGVRPHPKKQKLRLVRVFDGTEEHEVVCGAPNVPEPGGLVVFAGLGAILPGGLEIGERKLGGVVSRGMLCAEAELGIGADADGILVLTDEAASMPAVRPGAPVADALSLSDVVYEIGLTPNRPDCLGHLGLARDLCAIADAPFALPAVPPVASLVTAGGALFPQQSDVLSLAEAFDLGTPDAGPSTGLSPLRVDIAEPTRCLRYGAALVTDVTIRPSAFATRYRLFVLGQRPINNVVDATNLILLGFGHPIHAFAPPPLSESRIVVRSARAGEQIKTLDDETRTLTEDDLLICDGAGPVALAGVMGGGNSEIHAGTRRVLIECAYFEPRTVRRTSKRTGLHTDSSHRFERGVDPNGVPRVLAHAASLIAGVSDGQLVAEALDVHPTPVERAQVTLRLSRARALIGAAIAPDLAMRVLTALGCEVSEGDAGLSVLCPTHRPDLTREVDLIEELARIAGYDTIPTEVPTIRPSGEGTLPEVRFVRAVRESAAAAGLHEAVNFAFVSPADLSAARLPVDAPRLENPMSEERSVLRTGLLPGLSANLQLAQRHQLQRFAQFEVARVFRARAGERLPEERYELGIMLWGQRGLWYQETESMDFYDLKGAVEATLAPLLVAPLVTELDPALAQTAPHLHPRRAAAVRLGGELVGHLGELHPDVVDQLSLSGRPLFAALRVADLIRVAHKEGFPKARDLPRYPAAVRDVAVVVDEEVPAGEVSTRLAQAGGSLVEEVRLFDIYRGKPVPDGQKSFAFHVVYRDPSSTLTDKAVDKAHAKLTRAAEQHFGASVRK